MSFSPCLASRTVRRSTLCPPANDTPKSTPARQRRRLQVHERLERDRRQAQQAAEALHQALEDLGLPANLVVEIEGRLHSQQKLLGKRVGVMFPTLWLSDPAELCRVCWDKQWPPGCWGPCPNAWLKRRGAWRWRCWSRSGAMSTTKPGDPESLAVDLGLG